jgi:hypothetical protein
MVNLKKFEQVLHYIIHRCGNLQNIGKTEIWKILYFSDFDFYELYEEKLTDEDYFKLSEGHSPFHFEKAISILRAGEKIEVKNGKYNTYNKIKYISLQEPKINLLTTTEIRVIDKTINKLSNMIPSQINAYCFKDIPWEVAKDKEKLDYDIVFYRDALMSVREYPQ